MKPDIMIIGGTGVGDRLTALPGKLISLQTAFGMMRGKFVEMNGLKIIVVARHSKGHKSPPHSVNYGAIASAAKQLGVRGVFATAAVGTLRTDLVPGTICVCRDFVDFTCRNFTVHEKKVVHCDVSGAFSPVLKDALIASGLAKGLELPQVVYLGLNGPRYETHTEIKLFQGLHCDVVGMTASTEAIAMAELGVPYACLAIITNFGAGLEGSILEHGHVTEIMQDSGAQAIDLITAAGNTISLR